MNQTSLATHDRADTEQRPRPHSQSKTPAVLRYPVPDRNGFIFWLDEPQMWRSKSRWLRLGGWCLHTSTKPVIAIRVLVGGREFGTSLGIARPDVIRYFAQPQQNSRCGFSVDVRLPRQRQMLVIEAKIIESEWTRVFATSVRGPLLAEIRERRRQSWRG